MECVMCECDACVIIESKALLVKNVNKRKGKELGFREGKGAVEGPYARLKGWKECEHGVLKCVLGDSVEFHNVRDNCVYGGGVCGGAGECSIVDCGVELGLKAGSHNGVSRVFADGFFDVF